MAIKAKRAPLRSQESINEEILVNQIVSKAYIDAGEIKKKKEQAKKRSSANKPKKKKPSLRSQDSIQEEQMFSQIMSEAWQKAEVLKEKTKKMRKKAEMNRKKPKLHTQQSIMEEQAVKTIVNKAWENTHPDDNATKLDNICENNFEDESSFEASESGDDTPKKVILEAKNVEKIQKNASLVAEKRRTRRSRANRMGSKDMTSSISKLGIKKNSIHQEMICKSPLKESNYSSCLSRKSERIEISEFNSPVNQENIHMG